MGRVFKKNATFWIDYTDARGRRVRKSTRTGDKSAARMILAEAEKLAALQREGLTPLIDNRMKLDALLERYRLTRRPGTAENMTYHFRPFLAAIQADTVNDLTREKALAYLQEKRRGGWSPRTCNITRTYVLAGLNWAAKMGLIQTNPLVGLPMMKGDPVKRRRCLEPDEAERLLAASVEPFKTIWIGFLTTGARASELIGLTLGDLNAFRRELTIRAESSKTHRSRTIPLHPLLWERLKDRRGEPGEPLFHLGSEKPLDRGYLLRRLKRDLARAGVPNEGTLDLQALRATAGTWLLREGVPVSTVQKILGHASPKTTLAHYAKMTGADVENALEKLPLHGDQETEKKEMGESRIG